MHRNRILAGLMAISLSVSNSPMGITCNNSIPETVHAQETDDASADLSTSKALEAAKKDAENKEKELFDAQELVTQCQSVADTDAAAFTKAEKDKQTAEANLEVATNALKDANASLEETNNAIANIDSLIEKAESDKATADNNVKSAQAAYDANKTSADNANDDYTQAVANLDELKSAKDTADKNAANSKDAYETALSNYNTVKTDSDTKKSAMDSAKAELDTAKDELTNAESAYNTAVTSYSDLVTKVDNLKEAYDTANSRKEQGTYGFFDSLGSTAAKNALTSCKYKDYIQLGAADDATSLDNMALTFDHIRRLNTIRKSVGLGELKITSTLMAQAQADADYSDTIVAHAQQFNVAENVAWNYGTDPYLQWYDKEKAAFDIRAEELGQTTELTGAAAYNFYTTHSDSISFSTYGHYLNDINPGHKTTGFAYMNRGTMNNWKTYAQVFSGITSEKSYTVDEYEDLFNQYKVDIDNAIKNYNDAVTEKGNVEETMNQAGADKTIAENKVTAKQNAYDTACGSYNTSKTKLEQADTALNLAKTEYNNAADTKAVANTAYYNQSTVVEAKKKAFDTANTELTKAEKALSDSKNSQTTAAEELSSLHNLAQNKERILKEKQDAATAAQTDKEAKETAVLSANAIYEAAAEKTTVSQNALNNANAKLSYATVAYNNALAAVTAAQSAYDNEHGQEISNPDEQQPEQGSQNSSEPQQTTTQSGTAVTTVQQSKWQNTSITTSTATTGQNTSGSENTATQTANTVDETVTFTVNNATYEVSEDGEEVEYVKLKKKNATSVVIPATVKFNGITYKVTSIRAKAFYSCKKLKSVTIGTNVESIGAKVFYNTRKLTTIKIKTKKLTKDEVSSTAFKKAGKNNGKKLIVKVPSSKKKLYRTIINNKNLVVK